MFKKMMLVLLVWLAATGFALAQVDVNKGDQAALDGIKGVGATMSKAILAERKKGGDFKDWADLQKRVKGIGDKNSIKLSQAGLTVNGQAKAGAEPGVLSKAVDGKLPSAKDVNQGR
jgi:competence protein ComEA